jgi:tetratricopeptide (TPR) repeat protein
MGEAAALISAIAFLILVCGGFCVLYRPPRGIRGFSVKGFGVEFQPASPPELLPTTQGPIELGTTEPPAAEKPQEKLAEQAPAASKSHFSEIFGLFEKKNFKQGFELVRQELVTASDPEKAVAQEAFYLYLATEQGSSDAFIDLQKHAKAHPKSWSALFWLGRAFENSGRFEDAITSWNDALSSTADEEERVYAATALQRVLTRLERNSEAREILLKELARTNAPAHRASLYLSLGSIYEAEKSPDDERAFAMRELALRSTPSDKRLRFSLAHDYSKRGADELAFVHYQVLLEEGPKDPAAENNIGVSSERLSLPFTSTAHYKAAKAAGETLAAANLAYRLISVGFKDEATALLEEARQTENVHHNVQMAIGQIAENEVAEETKIERLKERVDKLRKFRVQYGDALLRAAPKPDELSGTYSGVPSALELKVADDLTVQGSFKTGKPATLIGKMDGCVLTFEWTEKTDSAEWRASWTAKSGHGVLLFSGTRADGYWYVGDADLDSKKLDSWREWHLTKS